MNSLQQLVVILPCHTLEDFPVRHDEQNAASLLANWTALWHPGLIARARQMPDWVSSDFVTIEFNNALVLAPISCTDNVPLEIADAVDAGNAQLVSGLTDRTSIFEHELVAKWIEPGPDQDLIKDFFALGYAYLQVQLMTRQLRYSSSIDVTTFSQAVVDAATAATENDLERAGELLQRCFDLVAQERSSYYPTDPSLLDFVLVADSTLGNSLNRQLEFSQPSNWLLTGSLLEKIEARNPAAYPVLIERIVSSEINVVGGFEVEMPSNLGSLESITNQLIIGLQRFEGQGIEVETFASRLFNLGPHLPQPLTQLGFSSAIHAAFAGGDLPTDCAPVMNWQGNDGTNLPALGIPPLDAGSARSFLKLSIKIGEVLDGHHHCPLLLVHWPGRTSEYFDDLVRVLRYAPIFGKFTTFRSFNDSLYDNGFSEAYEADNYTFPWLKTSVEGGKRDSISRFADYWRLSYRLQAATNALSTFAILEPDSDYKTTIEQLDQISRLNEQSLTEDSTVQAIEQELEQFFSDSKNLRLHDGQFDEDSVARPIFNGGSSAKQISVQYSAGAKVDEVAAFSFVNLRPEDINVQANDPDVAIIDENSGLPLLRNEIFELRFDEATGGIRSVNRHQKKGNLFSQHIAIRKSETVHQHGFPRQRFCYVTSRLEKIEVVEQQKGSATVLGLLKLVDNKSEPLCQIKQRVTVRRRSRIIEFDLLVESLCELSGPVWNNYLASRLAFPDKELLWRRSDHEIRVPIRRDKFVAPQFVEIANPGASKVTLLPAGLPFHRQIGERRLDTLLAVQGESQRHFQFAIAIDSPTSAAAAKSYQSPLVVLSAESQYTQRSGWIFSLNCQNVVVTHLRPKYGPSGTANGVIMRMIETEKRSGELKLRLPFNLQSAIRTDFLGEKLNDLDFEGDEVTCNFCEHQYFQLECSW